MVQSKSRGSHKPRSYRCPSLRWSMPWQTLGSIAGLKRLEMGNADSPPKRRFTMANRG